MTKNDQILVFVFGFLFFRVYVFSCTIIILFFSLFLYTVALFNVSLRFLTYVNYPPSVYENIYAHIKRRSFFIIVDIRHILNGSEFVRISIVYCSISLFRFFLSSSSRVLYMSYTLELKNNKLYTPHVYLETIIIQSNTRNKYD